jgi:hypothetical protein
MTWRTVRSSVWTWLKYSLYRLIGLNAKAAKQLDLYLSRRTYRRMFGREPNLSPPVLYSEKIIARKLFDTRPVFRTICEKVLVRDFVAGRIGKHYLPELYQVRKRFEEIDFDRLPDRFVIKANHGCRWNVIVRDKRTFDRGAARKLFARWMKSNYYVNSREAFYRDIDRKILVEEFLEESDGASVVNYKIFVYAGIPKFFYVSQGEHAAGNLTIAHFTRDYQRLPIRIKLSDQTFVPDKAAIARSGEDPAAGYAFPANMEQMFDVASRLGQGFDFIRVDLYNPGGRILFGELTALPGGGLRPLDPPGYDRIFGQDWHLALRDP